MLVPCLRSRYFRGTYNIIWWWWCVHVPQSYLHIILLSIYVGSRKSIAQNLRCPGRDLRSKIVVESHATKVDRICTHIWTGAKSVYTCDTRPFIRNNSFGQHFALSKSATINTSFAVFCHRGIAGIGYTICNITILLCNICCWTIYL